MKEIFKNLTINRLFTHYAPNISNYRYKSAGKNSNNNPIFFSQKELNLIRSKMEKMFADTLKIFDKWAAKHLEDANKSNG